MCIYTFIFAIFFYLLFYYIVIVIFCGMNDEWMMYADLLKPKLCFIGHKTVSVS